MIASLKELDKVIATEYLKANKDKSMDMEGLLKELSESTYLGVGSNHVYFTSFLDTEVIQVTEDIYNLPLSLQDYQTLEKRKDGSWSRYSCDLSIDYINQVKAIQEVLDENRIESAIIVVEKGRKTHLEGLNKYLGTKLLLI